MNQTSSTEKQVARWHVSSRRTVEASGVKTRVDDKADDALWHYNHMMPSLDVRRGGLSTPNIDRLLSSHLAK